MKKYIYIIISVLTTFISCSTEETASSSAELSTGSGDVFTATIEGGVISRATLGEKTASGQYPVSWSSGDVIAINGIQYTTSSTGETADFYLYGASASVSSTDYKAVFPATMATVSGSGDTRTVTYSLPSMYTNADDKFDMPMCAVSTTKKLQFHNLCGILAVTVSAEEMENVAYIQVVADKQLNGAFTPSSNGTLTFNTKESLTSYDKMVTVTCGTTITSGSPKTFYIPVPPGTYSQLSVKVYGDDKIKIMPISASSITIARSNIYSITFAGSKCALTGGDFSVSASKTVKFTLGNLYWNGGNWKLEEKQTDCWYHTEWNTNHADLLSWVSVQDYNSGNAAYMPYNMSYSSGTKSSTDKAWYCEDNPITVDGVSGLYLLSYAEWRYLFETRTNASSLYKHSVTVGSTLYCTIIAPDGYDYKTNPLQSSYSSLDELNMYGILCLPPAGASDNLTYKQYIGQNCRYNACYLSSTLNDSGNYWFWYQNGSGHTFQTNPREYRLASRLVR